MMRLWMGVALLAGSWLLGLSYYYPADGLAWVLVVAFGTVLLGGSIRRLPPRRELAIALVLLLPAVGYASWPVKAAPLLIAAGLAIELLPIPRRWPRWLGRGAMASGTVLLVQSLAMVFYASQTARSHELPGPLVEMLAAIARLLGVDAAADGSAVVMHSIRQVHRLGATWELLIDPPTWCFFVGSLVLFGLTAWGNLPAGRRWPAWIDLLRRLAVVLVVWLPIRAGLMMGLYAHRVLRTDAELPLHAMNQFLSPWVLLLLLLGPVLLLAWGQNAFSGKSRPSGDEPSDEAFGGEIANGPKHRPVPLVLRDLLPVMLAVAVLTWGVAWDPVGTRKAGRVMVVERHSTWEPTSKPYDTTWYGHDCGYNYAALYDYCGQYYQMSRLSESEKIDRRRLDQCDVLVIKTPTARYSREEVDAVVRFVKRGGGLLLVGDHTNVFKCGTYMNDITRKMGFVFRDDLLFGTGDSPYEQSYRPPQVPHPVVQHLPPTDFAVSCSIDPGRSWGRAAIRGTGLFSLPPDYHRSNYHTVPQLRPDMRYGAFIQLWSTRFGDGRVLAFTDSTIFSNFCVFQPGKAELFRGMLEWLNHGDALGDPRPWLVALGTVLLAAGLWLARHRLGAWLVLVAAGTCGWVLASVAVAALGRAAMPVPEVVRPLPRVVIDRTTSDVLLSKGAYIQGAGEGYGLFEQWIPRLGCYTIRGRGEEAFSGEVLVAICPNRSVSPRFRQRLIEYVEGGGKLLVLDSPENTASTANSLLWPFGLSIVHGPQDGWQRGVLTLTDDWPGIELSGACEVAGGRTIARLADRSVGAVAHCKKGAVMAVGFASAMNDASFGYAWNSQPAANTLFTYDTYVRFNVQFALLRSLASGEPVRAFHTGHVVIDRTVSEVALPEPNTVPEGDTGFGLAEMWLPYLGYSTARGSGDEAFRGEALVVFLPSRPGDEAFRDRLQRYVAAGGKLLLVDSPDNEASTANDLLEPFGLTIDRDTVPQGRLLLDRDEDRSPWPNTEIDPACRVGGGRPFAWVGPTPVGATVRHGRGAVTAVGCGKSLANAALRGSWDLPPPAKSLVPYDLLTAVVRALMTDQPVAKSMPSVSD
ncbi:MAG: hypothetical protein JXB62_19815 [Pirellulales bacterium]|nr:hypothetical protein [Pirellulales bacterium]